MLRTRGGLLGTIEVGTVFPSDGRDAEMKVDFKKGILKREGGAACLHTREDSAPLLALPDPPSILEKIVRALIDWDRSPVDIRGCYLAVRLIDLAYLSTGHS